MKPRRSFRADYPSAYHEAEEVEGHGIQMPRPSLDADIDRILILTTRPMVPGEILGPL
jgi:hypothetical protein